MDFLLLSPAQKEQYRAQLFALLEQGDNDFVPPLSARFSTSDTAFSAETVSKNGVLAYFNDMIREDILAAVEDGALLGFVTFKKDLVKPPLDESTLPNLYICTLLVDPAARGRALTKRMYAHLFDTLYPNVNLYTRTWSTNAAHIAILSHFGFSLFKRIENDRGPGIDTVYFEKKRLV